MILSVSRRTDIPALYVDWFFDQLKQGFVLVPNPMNTKKIQKIQLQPVKIERNLLGGVEVSGNVDGIVFWSKNPQPLLARIEELKDFKFYFQYTLNAYDQRFEAGIPPLEKRIKTFQDLSKHCPVVWRYDPIFLGSGITIEWHKEQFENIAKQLAGYTDRCMIKCLRDKFAGIVTPTTSQIIEIATALSAIGKKHGIEVQTCAEIMNLESYGIKQGKCTDPEIFEKLLGNISLKTKKLDGQRKNCRCIPCVDIGVYDTCSHGCTYCYARHSIFAKATCSANANKIKEMYDGFDGEIYDRKTERIFDYK
ncbi:MAG: DUF1848 domain-containing protein [Christensenellaceae bacterium]|jgi:hypothetical protein|nr:DUF1848 domain-containing protein [Christensenellaceae bacterium]